MDYNGVSDNLAECVFLAAVSHCSSLFVGEWRAARNAERANESGSTSHAEVEKGKTRRGPQARICSWSVDWSSVCIHKEEEASRQIWSAYQWDSWEPGLLTTKSILMSIYGYIYIHKYVLLCDRRRSSYLVVCSRWPSAQDWHLHSCALGQAARQCLHLFCIQPTV